jgi:hypothetical protein
MRITPSSWKPLAFTGLFCVLLASNAACSKITTSVHKTLKLPARWTVAYQQGHSEARDDLAVGRFRIRTYGMPEVWNGPNLYAQHLRNDYNIELVTVASCVVTEDLINRTQGYNDTALPAIEARYGKGILEGVHKQAADGGKRERLSK